VRRASRCRGRRQARCRCVHVSRPSAAPRSQDHRPKVGDGVDGVRAVGERWAKRSFRFVGFCGVRAGRTAYGFGAQCREGRAPTFLAAWGGAFPATHSSAAGASRSACVKSSATTRLLTPPSPSATTATPPAGSNVPSATLPNRRGAVELPCVEPTWLGGRVSGQGLGSGLELG
jgi:hypothetical protein